MTFLVDTSVVIDYLRGHAGAAGVIEGPIGEGLHASEVTRLEVLAGMRPREEHRTRSVLSALTWHTVDSTVAERAGELGRAWLPSHQGLGAGDLAIAATALLLRADLLTVNVRHFPMFTDLSRPY